jgi:hypothetical protein
MTSGDANRVPGIRLSVQRRAHLGVEALRTPAKIDEHLKTIRMQGVK